MDIESVAADSEGNVYVAGKVAGSGDFGNGVKITGQGDHPNVMIVKYDVTGKAVWAKSMAEAAGESGFYSMAVDGSENVYAVGWMVAGKFVFGDKTVVGKNVGNLVLVKYDRSGETQWVRTIGALANTGSEGSSRFTSVAVDKSGNIYAAGDFSTDKEESVTFSPRGPGYLVLPEKSEGGALLAKFDPEGRAMWAAQVGRGDGSTFSSIAADDSGNIYAAGHVVGQGTHAFGNGVLLTVPGPAPSTRSSALLVKYNASGKAQWARTVKSVAADDCGFRELGLDSDGNIYAAGDISGPELFDFGNGVTVQGSARRINPLLMKYDPSGKPRWGRSLVNGRSDLQFQAATVDDKYVYFAGTASIKPGKATYDLGGNVIVQVENYLGSMDLLAAYDHSGTPQWVLMPPTKGNGHAQTRSMCTLGDGNMILGGWLFAKGALDFGNGVTVSGTSPNGSFLNGPFLVKYRREEH